MFGLSFSELLIIAVLALILLGPERLPDAARTLGKGMRHLQRASQDLKDELEKETQGLTAEIEGRTRDLTTQLLTLPSEEIEAIPSSTVPVPRRDGAAPAPVSPLAAMPVPGRDPAPAEPVTPASEAAAGEPTPGTREP
jgi:sec-independent protein translocase protein TatB